MPACKFIDLSSSDGDLVTYWAASLDSIPHGGDVITFDGLKHFRVKLVIHHISGFDVMTVIPNRSGEHVQFPRATQSVVVQMLPIEVDQ